MDQNRSSKNVGAKVKTSPKCRRKKCLFAKKVTLASRISLTHMLLVEHQKQNQMSHRVRVIQKQLLTMKKNFEDSNNHSPFHFFLSSLPLFFFVKSDIYIFLNLWTKIGALKMCEPK